MTDNTAPRDTEGTAPMTFPGTGGAPAVAAGVLAGDRSLDQSLRLLTALVTVALVASVSLLLYRWIAPQLDQGDSGPVAVRTAPPQPAPKAARDEAPRGDQVLMDPRHVFRCDDQGQVSFSDQACGSGAAAAAAAAARAAAAH